LKEDGDMCRALAVGLTVAACAVVVPAASGYAVDPHTGDRLDVPTTSRTSQGVHEKAKQNKGKQGPRPRSKPPLAPEQRSAP
jgi:hypothetical protein